MKYGYSDYEWKENLENWDAICRAIVEFNASGFQGFMKRKTYDEKDEKALAALTEMVEMMNKHKNEMVKK